MNSPFVFTIATVIFIFANLGTSFADDKADCFKGVETKQRVTGCTNLINSKRLNKRGLAIVHTQRGIALQDGGQVKRANLEEMDVINL